MISLNDNNNIIDNNIIYDTKLIIIDIITNFFDNYLNYNQRTFISEYINQYIFNRDKYDNIIFTTIITNINNLIKKYIIDERNNIRLFIKEDNYSFYNLNKFIKEYIIKITYISCIFKENKILINSIEYLSEFIISDSIILLFIENQILLFSINNNYEIKKFILTIQKISIKYDDKIYNQFIKKLCIILNKNIIYDIYNELPANLKRINLLNNNINYYNKILLYYEYISCDLVYDIIPNIYNNFINIIKLNSLNEIEYIISNKILDLIYIFNNKSISTNNLIVEICNLIQRIFDTNSNEIILINNISNKIISIINILNNLASLFKNNEYNIHIFNELNKLIDTDIFITTIYNEINSLVKNNNSKKIISLLTLIINIKDKDIIINKYTNFLEKRLLYYFIDYNSDKTQFKNYIFLENIIADFLKKKLGNKYVYKIYKMISDIDNSYNIQLNNTLHIIINISYNNWNINYSDCVISYKILKLLKNTPNRLIEYIMDYNNLYNIKYSDERLLNWYLHYGEVDITYLDQNLKMLPIQFMVVEMYNNKDIISLDEIINSIFFTNYPNKFRNDIINSLVTSKLFSITNNNLILTTNGVFKQDLITIFFDESEYIHDKKIEELALSYNDIIISNINHILKLKSLNYNELFDIVKNNIKVFNLDNKIFEIAIDYMINKDYIKIDNLIYKKIYY